MSLYKKSYRILVLFVLFIFFIGCDDEKTPAPVVLSFTPTSGEVGASVAVNGKNFGSNPVVFINETLATITGTPSANQIQFTVPPGASAGKIKVVAGSAFGLSTSDFVVLNVPVIESFSPAMGNTGTAVTITGKNFTSASVVKFNGIAASVTTAASGSITTAVPAGATYGKITVTTSDGTATSATEFIANPHTITSIVSSISSNPVLVSGPGHQILIKGTNFSETAAANIVKFNGVAVTVEGSSADQMFVILPSGITTGKISVTINNYTVAYDQVITVPPGEWKKTTTFTGGMRQMATAFVINDQAYYGTGFASPNYKDFWKFDSQSKSWSQVANMGGEGRRGAFAFSVNGKGYVGGGDSDSDLWEYDAAGNTWTKKATMPLGASKTSAFVFSINNKGYVTLGADKQLLEYDPSANAWTKKADFPGTVVSLTAGFVIANKAYVGTGYTAASQTSKEFWEYNPANNTWTKKADFPGKERRGAIGFAVDGYGYLGSGQSDGTINSRQDDMWKYDPTTDLWSASVPYVGTSPNSVSFTIGNKGYAGMPGYFDAGANFYEFTP